MFQLAWTIISVGSGLALQIKRLNNIGCGWTDQTSHATISINLNLIFLTHNERQNNLQSIFCLVSANVDQYERRFWVGATDQEIEQYWVWVDGSDVSQSYFHPNEPNNAYSGTSIQKFAALEPKNLRSLVTIGKVLVMLA